MYGIKPMRRVGVENDAKRVMLNELALFLTYNVIVVHLKLI